MEFIFFKKGIRIVEYVHAIEIAGVMSDGIYSFFQIKTKCKWGKFYQMQVFKRYLYHLICSLVYSSLREIAVNDKILRLQYC